MGSGQSSADRSEYTVDASGKIARVSRNTPKRTEDPANSSGTKQESGDGRANNSAGTEPPTNSERDMALDIRPLASLNHVARPSGPSDQLRLQEVDDILNRMKAKYKPNAAELAGKNRSVFEEIEQSLLHCYKVNKDQSLKCAALSEEYRRQVEKQRAQTLIGSARS